MPPSPNLCNCHNRPLFQCPTLGTYPLPSQNAYPPKIKNALRRGYQCTCVIPGSKGQAGCPIHDSDNAKIIDKVNEHERGDVVVDMPVIGFRQWKAGFTTESYRLSPFSPVRYVPRNFSLHSIGMGSLTWNLKEVNVARCVQSKFPQQHLSPTFDCDCGLYACKTVHGALAQGGGFAVTGAVLLSGEIIEHAYPDSYGKHPRGEGYRAERARILGVLPVLATRCGSTIDLSDYFTDDTGIPVFRTGEHLETYAKEFGVQL